MGKKKEQMTPEELAAAKARMDELRVKAMAKRMEIAEQKKVIQAELKEKKMAIHNKRAALIEKKEAEIKKLDSELYGPAPVAEPVPEGSGTRVAAPKEEVMLPMPPPRAPKPAAVNAQEANFFAMYQMMEDFKQTLKQKYKSKYAPQQQPPVQAAPPPINYVQETARETLKSKVHDEVRQLAHQALFGGAW